MEIPSNVQYILDELDRYGYEAYAVGGCVRDTLTGRTPGDWDITTSARPDQVKDIFDRTVDTGIKHGTVTVLLDKEGYEVTTYRIDGEYTDGRHPGSVTFTPSLEEDLKRRDFTINAMAYHPRNGIVDLFHGQEDLAAGIIRCVGNPDLRFLEDALRMMRAVRFAAQLDFQIEEKTLDAICRLAPSIQKISAERIREELMKTLVSPHPEYMKLFYETGLTAYFLPEFDKMMETAQNTPYHCYSVGEHTLAVLQNISGKPVLRLSALLHDVGKPLCRQTDLHGQDHFYGHAGTGASMARKILKRLKFDNDTMYQVSALILHHSDPIELTETSVRHAISKTGQELFPFLLQLMEADNKGKTPDHTNARLVYLQQVEDISRLVLSRGDCVTLKNLAINGQDLIRAGVPQGPQIGALLNQCLEEVLDDPGKNRHDILLEIALKNRPFV